MNLFTFLSYCTFAALLAVSAAKYENTVKHLHQKLLDNQQKFVHLLLGLSAFPAFLLLITLYRHDKDIHFPVQMEEIKGRCLFRYFLLRSSPILIIVFFYQTYPTIIIMKEDSLNSTIIIMKEDSLNSTIIIMKEDPLNSTIIIMRLENMNVACGFCHTSGYA